MVDREARRKWFDPSVGSYLARRLIGPQSSGNGSDVKFIGAT